MERGDGPDQHLLSAERGRSASVAGGHWRCLGGSGGDTSAVAGIDWSALTRVAKPASMPARQLRDRDHDEFGGLERRKADHDVHHAAVDIVLRCRVAVAFYEISLLRRVALECPLFEQAMHEVADAQAQTRP